MASGRAGQPSLQLAVRTGEPTCGSIGTPTGGSIGTTAEAKFGPSNRWFNRPYNRSKVRSFNSPPTDAKFGPSTGGSTVPTAEAKFGPSTSGSFVPPTDAKSGPSTGGSTVPTAKAKSGPSTAPSTDVPDSHANAPQPKSLTMQRDSGRTASAILKNLCEVTHFLYVKQNSPQLDCNLNSKCQPETTRTHRPDFEHQVYARETAKSLGILQSPIYGRS